MITKIVKYQTEDGVVFNTKKEAKRYETILESCNEVEATLMTTPEDDVNFNNGVGWIQHPKGTKDKLEKDILSIYNKAFKKEYVKINYYVARVVDDNQINALNHLINRWFCIDSNDREYGQVYYANNPEKAKGGQINGSPE